MYQTLSGGFCGDDVIQSAGGEICDGGSPLYYADIINGYLGGTCSIIGATDPSNGAATCQYVGVCNGGTNGGDICSPILSAFVPNGCMLTNDGGDANHDLQRRLRQCLPLQLPVGHALAQPYQRHGVAYHGERFYGYGGAVQLPDQRTCVNNVVTTFNDELCQVDAHCNNPADHRHLCV